MAETPQTAYVTGGASGIGRALVEMLVEKGIHVFIADINASGSQSVVETLTAKYSTAVIHHASVDGSSWPSQVSAFQRAVATFKRIDYVFPIAGIGEKRWLPPTNENGSAEAEFVEPHLSVLDVDLKGVLYTVALAVQQFKRQEVDRLGFRGKITCVASICGIYCIPTVPIYTAAKHGVVGFVRSYGKLLLPEHSITLNAICPNVVRTGISSEEFYAKMDREGLLVPMQGLLDGFAHLMGENRESGEIFECGPKGGFMKRSPPEYLDKESERSCDFINERALKLHRE